MTSYAGEQMFQRAYQKDHSGGNPYAVSPTLGKPDDLSERNRGRRNTL